FIFLSLIEFSVITYISRAEKRKIREIKTLRRNISQSQLSLASEDSQFTFTANDGKQLCSAKNSERFPFEGIEIKVPRSPKLNERPTLMIPGSPSLKKHNFIVTPPDTPQTPNFDISPDNSYDPLKKTPV
ncbi:unnamed protein product, partial [Oppiella nova]